MKKKYSWCELNEIQDALKRLLDHEYQKDWDDAEEKFRCSGSEHILDVIQTFLSGSFMVCSNPLPHLRNLFPEYLWRFYEFCHDEPNSVLVKAFSVSDIFWPAYPGAAEIYWVTMRRKDLATHPLVICGCRDSDFGLNWGKGPVRDLILGGKERVPQN